MKSLVKGALLLAFVLFIAVLGVVMPTASTVPGAAAATRQTGRTWLLPQIVQPGRAVAPANRARLAGSVSFRPVRKGRPVTIQRRVGRGAWHNVTTKRQNGAGVVEFRAAARARGGRWYTYRGVARPWDGLRQTAARAQNARVWRKKFSDEFTGTSLDLTKWSYRQLGVYSAANNRACSASSPDAVQVRDGRALLFVRPDPVLDATGPCIGQDKQGRTLTNNTHWYKNGHISTQNALNGRFRYGVAAARVKFDRNQGAHGAFWMQPSDLSLERQGPAAEAGAEIDAVEYFGKDFLKGDVYHCVHYYDADGQYHKVPDGRKGCIARRARRALTSSRDDWFKSYHVFSVEWTPKAYTFRVDGIKTRVITEGVSKVPEYLILSMLSSGWELEKMNRRTLPNATQVDWVRFWQK